MRTYAHPFWSSGLAALVLLAAMALLPLAASAQATNCSPVITVDQPTANATLQGPNTLGGWAIDMKQLPQAGVQDVRIYRDGEMGAGGVLVGQSNKIARPDVDAAYGLSGSRAGWTLDFDFGAVPAGAHTLYVYAMTSCGWSLVTVPVSVRATGPEINIDIPSNGQTVALGQRIDLGGWAADAAGAGSGIDIINIYADRLPGDNGMMLGSANYGKARADVATAKNKPEWINTGFDFVWTVSGLAPGPHTLYIYAHSTATGLWAYQTVDITVMNTPPPGDVGFYCSNGTGYRDVNGQCVYGNNCYNNGLLICPAIGAGADVVGINSASANIGSFNAPNSLIFTISLAVPAVSPVTVNFATSDGTAHAGVDYLPASGTVVFMPGQQSKSVTVQTIGTNAPGPTKTFFVQLSNPLGATLSSSDNGYVYANGIDIGGYAAVGTGTIFNAH